ncbi:MAG: SRPBCC family protein [Actinomycetota bacterium]|nr:SRPBCC family protein [Actinomycetota bacterium]
MTTMTETTVTTQAYQVYIKATPEAIWDALTKSEWAERYGYRGRVDYELRPGGAYHAYATEDMLAMGAPEVIIEGEVLEADAPRKLVQTWNALFDPQIAAEAETRLAFELEPAEGGVTKLTLTHEFEGAPTTAALVGGTIPNTGGGWPYVLSDLKTLLETGKPLAG